MVSSKISSRLQTIPDQYFQRPRSWSGAIVRNAICVCLLTLLPWSRVRTRSLLTCVSAMSALSSASLSSCWSFLYLDRLQLACSSCRHDWGFNDLKTCSVYFKKL